MAAADGRAAGRRGRRPTREEQELWERTVRDATPLRAARTGSLREAVAAGDVADARPGARDAPAGAERMSGQGPTSPGVNQTAQARPAALAPAPAAAPVRSAPELAPGRMVGIDRRTAERLRRGQLPIDARIDLHGMTRAAAKDALVGFLHRAGERGHRCVLVITGKGSAGDGVLRREVPQWLNLPGLRGGVIGFVEAQPRHGGAGALYVLLRRRRAT